MFKLPEDEANLKYQLALLDVVVMNGNLLTIDEMDKYVKLLKRFKDIKATKAIMEAVYEEV